MLSKILIRNFTNICLFAGSLKQDKAGAEIMKRIKQRDPMSKFAGIGGPLMKAVGMQQFDCASKFDQKQFFNYTYYRLLDSQSYFSPLRMRTHYKNYKILKNLKKLNVAQKIIINNYEVVLFLGNQAFMRKFSDYITTTANHFGMIRPTNLFFTLFHSHLQHQLQQNIDHVLYRLPREYKNWQFYSFPSTPVGYQGIFQHYRKIGISPESNRQIWDSKLREANQNQRQIIRKQYDIQKDKFIIVLYPGQTNNDLSLTLNLYKNAIKQFTKNLVTSLQTIQLLYIIPQFLNKQETIIKSLQQFPIKSRSIPYSKRLQALVGKLMQLAADFGVICNGQVTVQAAACQTPILVVDPMGMLFAYYTHLFNQFGSPLNLSLKGEGYEQLLSKSQAHPSKVASYIDRHYKNPKLKYFYMKSHSQVLHGISQSEIGTYDQVCKKIEEGIQEYNLNKRQGFREMSIDMRKERYPRVKKQL